MSWVVGVHDGSVGHHFHLLVHVADRQTQVNGRVLTYYQRDASADPFGKAGLFGAYVIPADGKSGQFVSPGLVRDRRAREARVQILCGYRGPDTTAPVWSVTRPDKPADTCAPAGSEQRHNIDRPTTQSHRQLADIVFSVVEK